MRGALMLLYFLSVMCSGYSSKRPSASLRESFRNNLRQLLAYTAFSTEKKKHCVLVAPFSRFERSKMKYRSAFSDATIEIFCLGIPFSASSLSETVNQLSKWCQSLTWSPRALFSSKKNGTALNYKSSKRCRYFYVMSKNQSNTKLTSPSNGSVPCLNKMLNCEVTAP